MAYGQAQYAGFRPAVRHAHDLLVLTYAVGWVIQQTVSSAPGTSVTPAATSARLLASELHVLVAITF